MVAISSVYWMWVSEFSTVIYLLKVSAEDTSRLINRLEWSCSQGHYRRIPKIPQKHYHALISSEPGRPSCPTNWCISSTSLDSVQDTWFPKSQVWAWGPSDDPPFPITVDDVEVNETTCDRIRRWISKHYEKPRSFNGKPVSNHMPEITREIHSITEG